MKKLLLLIPVLFLALIMKAQDEELLLYWSFDDGTATDLSGNNHNGELNNVAAQDVTPLSDGKSMYFDGTEGSYILNYSIIDYLTGLKAFTVSMWIKSDEVATDRGFIICHEPDNADRYLTMRYDKAGYTGGGTNVIKAGISVSDDGLADTIEFNQETISEKQTTEWQHLAFCWESGEEALTLFIDGYDNLMDEKSIDIVSAVQAPNPQLPADPYLYGMTNMYVGKGGKDVASSWLGYVDEVVILNYKVTSEEVGNLMNGDVPYLNTALKEAGSVLSGISIIPNPFKTSTRIEFCTSSHSRVSLAIYDVCGKFIQELTDEFYQQGNHSINWVPSTISPGVYIGRMKVKNTYETFKLVVQ
jgi:hypothetical protein